MNSPMWDEVVCPVAIDVLGDTFNKIMGNTTRGVQASINLDVGDVYNISTEVFHTVAAQLYE